MWLGCFLRAAVRLLEESMLAEMALIATWLGPAASSKAWLLVLLCGECTGIAARRGEIKTKLELPRPHTKGFHSQLYTTITP